MSLNGEARLMELLQRSEETCKKLKKLLSELQAQNVQYQEQVKALELMLQNNKCSVCRRMQALKENAKDVSDKVVPQRGPSSSQRKPKTTLSKASSTLLCPRCHKEPVYFTDHTSELYQDIICKKCKTSKGSKTSCWSVESIHFDDMEVLHEETVRDTKQRNYREEIDDVPFVPGSIVDVPASEHVCQHCGKSFSKRTSLQQHERIHGFKSHKCDVCGKVFASERTKQRHLKMIHENKDRKKHVCEVCKKTFSYPQNLKIHKESQQHFTNADEESSKPLRLFECPLCPKTFKVKSNLHPHIRTHTKEKPYQCSLCAKRFCQMSQCKIHEKIHSGEKPYKCELCSKVFSSNGHLKRHVIAHNGNRNYICASCGKGFTQEWNLKCHERLHKCEQSQRNAEVPPPSN